MQPFWPDAFLTRDKLAEISWHPVAFREFVLKVHQRCNLSCEYCYMYALADQSWRTRPVLMSSDVYHAAAARMAEHVAEHNLNSITVVLHGGEPLLAGIARLTDIVTVVRAAVRSMTTITFCLQTNGILLTPQLLEQLQGLGVQIGVSLDGDAAAHDRRRRHHDGRASYVEVAAGLRLLASPPFRQSFGGLLCVVDVASDPVACYDALVAWEPPRIDFLLGHTHWSADDRPDALAHGVWLARAFDRWYDAPAEQMRVRLFDDLVQLVLGGMSRSEQVGLSPVAVAVVETDGAIEQTDALKSSFPGAASTGYNVHQHPFDEALTHPGVVARQIGAAALSEECLSCPERAVCGGGHYAHRYRAGSGYRNPTVYCAGMYHLARHVRSRIEREQRVAAPP